MRAAGLALWRSQTNRNSGKRMKDCGRGLALWKSKINAGDKDLWVILGIRIGKMPRVQGEEGSKSLGLRFIGERALRASLMRVLLFRWVGVEEMPNPRQ